MRKVIKFSATWCGPCKMLSKVLEEVVTDIPFEHVDIDENQDLAKQYGVRGVPTMIMLEDDQVVKTLVGMQQQSKIEQWLAE